MPRFTSNIMLRLLLPILPLFFMLPSSPQAEDNSLFSEEIAVARGLFNDSLYALAVKELKMYVDSGVKEEEMCTVELLIGKSYYLMGSYENTISPLSDVLKKHCLSAQQEEAYYYLGDSYLRLGRREESRRSFERLQSLYPKSSFIDASRGKLGEILYLDGIGYFDGQKYAQALANFEQVNRLKPDSVSREELLVKMGDALFYLGEYGKAKGVYGKAAKIYSEGETGGRIRFQIAVTKYNLGRYDEAIAEMKGFLEKYPEHSLSSRGRNTVLWSLYKQGRYEDALDYLKQMEGGVGGAGGKDVRNIIVSARDIIISGDYIKATKLLEEGLAGLGEDPLNGVIMLLLASAHRGAGMEMAEMETYREIIARYPVSPSARESRYILARMAFEKGIFTEAEKYFRSFVEGDSLGELADDARYNLAESLFLMGEFDEAKEQFLKVVENFKDSEYRQGSELRIADINMHTGRYSEAALGYISIMKRLRDDREIEKLLWKTAEAFRRGGDYKAADKVYRRYLKDNPEGERAKDAAEAMGDLSYYSGDYGAGVKVFKKLIDDAGKNDFSPAYALKLARGYMRLQDAADAVEIFDRIIGEYPKSREAETAHYMKGLVAQEEGKYENANRHYRELLRRFPDSPLSEDAKWQTGNNYYLLGKYEEALSVFRGVAKDFPNTHRNIEEMLRKCYIAKGDFRSAIESSGLFYEMDPDRVIDLKKRSEEAMALFEVGSYRDAVKVAEGIVNKFPSHPLSAKTMIVAGESSLREGMFGDAERYFMMGREYLKAGRLRDIALFRLGEMAFNSGDFRESSLELEKMSVPAAPGDGRERGIPAFMDEVFMRARRHYMLGDAYLNLNMSDRALENFGMLVDNYPDLKGLGKERLKAGLVLQQHKEYDKAITAMRQLISASEDSAMKAEAQYWIGENYQYMGNLEQAIVEYLKVTYLYPSENMWALTARYMAAQVCQQAGEYEKAINLYKKVADESQDKRKSEYAKKRIEELVNRLAESAQAVIE